MTIEPLREEEIEAIRAVHTPDDYLDTRTRDGCGQCNTRRPCDSMRLLATLDALTAHLGAAGQDTPYGPQHPRRGYLSQNQFLDMEYVHDNALHFRAHDGDCIRCGHGHGADTAVPATRQALADALDARCEEVTALTARLAAAERGNECAWATLREENEKAAQRLAAVERDKKWAKERLAKYANGDTISRDIYEMEVSAFKNMQKAALGFQEERDTALAKLAAVERERDEWRDSAEYLERERDAALAAISTERVERSAALANALARLREVEGALAAFVEHWDGYDDAASEWHDADKKGSAIVKRARALLAPTGVKA